MSAKPIDALEFHGAIGNMPFGAITMNQFINSLNLNGWREAHNAHIYQRLVERGAALGVHTPNDFARALRDGQTLPAGNGASMRACRGGLFWVIFRDHQLITIRHPAER